MPIEVKASSLPAGTPCVLRRWYVKEGHRVGVGQVLAEVAAGQADHVIRAGEAGVVRTLRVPEGASVTATQTLLELESAESSKTEDSVPSLSAKGRAGGPLLVECGKCGAAIPMRAKFCPRCGEVNDRSIATAGWLAPQSREILLGWLLWIAGSLLFLAGLFLLSGARGWIAIGLGIALFVTGLGTLVGDQEKPKGKKRKRKKKH